MSEMDAAYQALMNEARLGQQTREFLASEIGRYVHARAKADYEQAKQKLLTCNPNSFFGRRKIRQLQTEAMIAEGVLRYLADAITNGELALQQLDYEYEVTNR